MHSRPNEGERERERERAEEYRREYVLYVYTSVYIYTYRYTSPSFRAFIRSRKEVKSFVAAASKA